MFAIRSRDEIPACLVEQSVNAALKDSFVQAGALLLKPFLEINFKDPAADFVHRHAAIRQEGKTP